MAQVPRAPIGFLLTTDSNKSVLRQRCASSASKKLCIATATLEPQGRDMYVPDMKGYCNPQLIYWWAEMITHVISWFAYENTQTTQHSLYRKIFRILCVSFCPPPNGVRRLAVFSWQRPLKFLCLCFLVFRSLGFTRSPHHIGLCILSQVPCCACYRLHISLWRQEYITPFWETNHSLASLQHGCKHCKHAVFILIRLLRYVWIPSLETTKCLRPRNLSRFSGSSILIVPKFGSVNFAHTLSCSSAGPDMTKSSTYTLNMSFSFGNQKLDGCSSMACPPHLIIDSVKCFSQCAPDSGCPYNAITNLHIGALYLRPQRLGLSRCGIRIHVGCFDFSFVWTYALMASAWVVLWPGRQP